MNYFSGIGGIFLLQAAVSYAVILAGTGNGSFVGLGAMLFAIFGLPTTAVLNFVFIREHRMAPDKPYLLRIVLFSSVLPVLQIALLAAVKFFRL